MVQYIYSVRHETDFDIVVNVAIASCLQKFELRVNFIMLPIKSILAASMIILCGCTQSNSSPIISTADSNVILPEGLPFPELVQVDNTLYLSGQIGILPGELKLVEGGIEAETLQTMENIKAVLEAHGHSLEDLVKCTVMIDDISQWGVFNKVYSRYFAGKYPARSAFGVSELALGAAVEIDCIAVVNRN